MLIDTKLLPIYKKALDNHPESIFQIGTFLQVGEGVNISYEKAAEWYEKLLAFPEKLEFVDYALLYYWAAIAAMNRADNKTALKRLRKSFKLFFDKYSDDNDLEQALKEIDFYTLYGYLTLRVQLLK